MKSPKRGKNGKAEQVARNDSPKKPVEPQSGKEPPRSAKGTTNARSLAERLAPFIGQVKDLPPDMSVRLDEYLYGVRDHE
jgi:hypothetical protein